jgi:hypothetical protein
VHDNSDPDVLITVDVQTCIKRECVEADEQCDCESNPRKKRGHPQHRVSPAYNHRCELGNSTEESIKHPNVPAVRSGEKVSSSSEEILINKQDQHSKQQGNARKGTWMNAKSASPKSGSRQGIAEGR